MYIEECIHIIFASMHLLADAPCIPRRLAVMWRMTEFFLIMFWYNMLFILYFLDLI
jgi:hypothetical protein